MIGFAGLSHLGLVSSIATAEKGFDVVAYGQDVALCEDLNRGHLPFFEPGLFQLLSSNSTRISFTADATKLADCEVIYLSLDIATDENGRSDLSGLEQLIGSVIPLASPGTTLVVLSQVPPGFTRQLAGKIECLKESLNLQLFYQVETLIFGRAVERALNPERVIVGCGDRQKALPEAYAQVLSAFGCPIMPMRYESAELAKISINMCLVSAIAAANTLAELCERIGAEWSEIVPALKSDQRIGQHAYLNPGLGIAGGNLERDLATIVSLANEFGTDDGVVDAWISNSSYRRDWALRIMHAEMVSCAADSVIAVWGLAYKQDTTSTKNSPAIALIESLKQFSVCAYDPQVVLDNGPSLGFVQAASALDACRGANALAIMTPWQEFSSISINQLGAVMKGRVIVDPFGVLESGKCAEEGFSYFKLGSTGLRGNK